MAFNSLDTDDKIISAARDSLESGIQGWEDNNREAREDLAFALNEQWSATALSIRKRGKRPAHTFNVIDRLVDHVSGQARQNPQQIAVRPDSAETSRFSALIAESILRGIHRDSKTQHALEWSQECATRVGRGHFRILPVIEHPMSFDYTVQFARVDDPWTIISDPRGYDVDGSDTDWRFVFKWLTIDEYEQAFGSAAGISSESIDPRILERWYEIDKDTVRKVAVAEFFWREFPGGNKRYLIETEGDVRVIINKQPSTREDGSTYIIEDGHEREIVRFREHDLPQTKMSIIAGHKVLTQPVEWPSPRIPIYDVLGREIIGDGTRRLKSLTANTRDAQRLVNTSFTSAAESVAAMVKAPFVGSWASVSKYWKRFWSKANDPTTILLPFDADPDLPDGGRPKREVHNPNIAGQAQLLAQALELVRWTSGVSEQATGVSKSGTSGRAIIAEAQLADQNTFAFQANATRALEAAGVDLVQNILPAFYSGERVVRAMFADDQKNPTGVMVGINGASVEDQREVLEEASRRAKIRLPEDFLDTQIWDGRYGVTVTTGRAHPTRRLEAQETILNFMQYVPGEMIPTLLPILLEFSDWPGATEIASAIRNKFPELSEGKDGELPPGEGAPQEGAGPEGGNEAGAQAPPELVDLIQQVVQQMHQSPEFVEFVQRAAMEAPVDRSRG